MICRNIFFSFMILFVLALPAQANDKAVPIELDHFIGYWQAPDNEKNNMAIVLPEKPFLGDVEVHSNKRAWKGWIEKKPTNDNPENQVLKLSYLPRAEEMNKKIPKSIRDDLDGVLEWKMEISLPDGAYSDELKAVWHRGHIEWKRKPGGDVTSHEITGEGKPIEFTLKRKPMLTVQMGGGINLDIRLAADIGMDRPEGAILQNLIQFQQLFAFVRMPEHEADKVGKVLDVKIKGLTSGATQSIRLFRTPSLPGKRVIYTHKDAFSLGECGIREARYDAGLHDPVKLVGQISSLFFANYHEHGFVDTAIKGAATVSGISPTITGMDEHMFKDMKSGKGHCKDFNGKHLERIEFSYKDAAFRLQYFDHWVGYTLARQESALENAYRVLIDVHKHAPDETSKQAAEAKLQMIENYWQIVDRADLTPLHKVAIGEVYLGNGDAPAKYLQSIGGQYNCPTGELRGLLHMDPAKIDRFADSHCLERPYEPDVNWAEMFKYLDDRPGQHAHDRFLKILPDINWISPAEQNLVNYAVKHSGTKAMNDVAKQFTKTGILTMYQVTTNVSVGFSAADMYLMFTGYDIMGQKKKTSERLLTGLTIFNDSIDMTKTLHEAFHPHMFFNENIKKKDKDDKGGWMSGWYFNEDEIRSSTHNKDIADSIEKQAHKQQSGKVGAGNIKAGDVSGWSRNKSKMLSTTHLNDIADSITQQAVRQQSGKAAAIERVIARTSAGDIKISEKLDAKASGLPKSLSEGQRKQLSLQLDQDLPKPDDQTVLLNSYPDLKMSASADLPKPDKTVSASTATVRQSYGVKTKIIQDKRTQNRTPLANANKHAHSNASHILATQSGKDYKQVDSPAAMTAILDSAAAKGDVSLHGRKHAGVTQPHNINTMREFYQSHGYDMAVSDPKMNKRVNAAHVASAVESGTWVETVMLVPNEDGTPTLRNIVIEDVLLDADGTPTRIAAFDPVMQTLVDMDAQDFNKTLARDIKQGNMRMITPNDMMKTQAIPQGRYVFPDNTKTVKLDTDSAPTIKIDPTAQKTIKLSTADNIKHFSEKYGVDKTKTTKINNPTFRNDQTSVIQAEKYADAKARINDAERAANAKAEAKRKYQGRGTEKLPAGGDIVKEQQDLYKQQIQNAPTEKMDADQVAAAKADADLDKNFGLHPDPNAGNKTQRFTPNAEDMKKTARSDINDHIDTKKLNLNPEDINRTKQLSSNEKLTQSLQNFQATSPEAGKNFAFLNDDGEKVSLPLGDVIGEGVAAKVYNHSSDPNLVIKISADGISNNVGSKIDNLGRIPFEQQGSKIDQKYLRIPTRGKLYTTTDGKAVQIIEKAKGELASKILKKQNKLMTKGQAYAFERAARMINEEGFVWLDNHKSNFHLVKIGDGDQWKIEIVDTGGIIPAKGNTRAERAKNARTVQRAVSTPSAEAIQATTGKTGALVFHHRMGHVLHGDNNGVKGVDLLNFDAIHDGYDADNLQFHPEIAYNQPFIREFGAMSDTDFKAAATQVTANAKPAIASIDSSPATNVNSYDWVLPHVLNFTNSKNIQSVDGR